MVLEQDDKDITFFIGSIGGGGAERVLCELANYLSHSGYHIKILTLTDHKNSYYIDPKIEYCSLDKNIKKHSRLLRIIVKIFRLYNFLKDNKTNVYVVFLPETISLITLMRMCITCPVIISERNDPSSYNKITQKLLIYAAKKNEGIVFQTESARNFYETKADVKIDCCVIPNAVKKDFLDPYEGPRNNIIVSVGRFNEQKNFQLLIKAFSIVTKELPEYKLVIYGTGPTQSKCIELAEKLRISDKIVFAGFTNNIKEKIRKSALFVLPSDYEGIPNALMEAMALGIPCVATDCRGGGAKLLIGNNKNGIIVSPNSPGEMATAMQDVLTNKTLSRQLSQNGAIYMKEFHPNVIYKMWGKYIDKICGSATMEGFDDEV